MAPGNNERHPGHTGTIPKTKVRNNCNVPQEAVTPTRRDMATNLVSTSLDWVPVSEYNTRTNYNQSRKQTNNTSDQELTDLDNSVVFESGFGRFVPVRPQPRALPLNVQNPNIVSDSHEEVASSSASANSLHPYAHHMQNGINPHSNHATHANHVAAAVMIVNPTTPNAVTGNMSQPFNAQNQNRNNLTRNLNPARNNFEGSSHSSNNNLTPPISNARTVTKTVNIMNNMYDQGQGSFNNINDNNHIIHRESARALGEAMVAACPDAAAVERRLGQIREYIRVTSSLVDTMRNSEDEAFIEHTKEEYDELVQMVEKLKESEKKLENLQADKEPDNVEVPAVEIDETSAQEEPPLVDISEEIVPEGVSSQNIPSKANDPANITLKKVTNIENEQLNKTLHSVQIEDAIKTDETSGRVMEHLEKIEENNEEAESNMKEIESETVPQPEENQKVDQHLNDVLKKNILSCVEKVARIEEMKTKSTDCSSTEEQQDVVVRPMSVQSNGSAYSDNELWQNEIKSKMEMSSRRLAALKQQQKRLLKYQEEAKQHLDELNRERQSRELHPASSHENFSNMQSQSFGANYHQPNRMYAANQIGVATTLPHSETMHGSQSLTSNIEHDHGHSVHPAHNQEDRFSHRDAQVGSGEDAAVGGRDSDAEEDEGLLGERGLLQMKLHELQAKKQHMESLVTEFQKLQMATRAGSSRNTYSSSGEDSGVDEARKRNNAGANKNDDPFKLMEIKAIKTALQKTKDLMRSVENYETDHLTHDESFQVPSHSNIHDNKSEGGGSMGGWSNEGSVCRVRNTLAQRHKFTNEQHSQQQSHEANVATLQELAQELRMETEKIMGERARIKDMASNKEMARKQKKVNEEVRAGPSGVTSVATGTSAPGPAERRQMQLRSLLAEKQRELEALLNKEILCGGAEGQKQKTDSRTASVVNQSYASEPEEPDSRSEQLLLDSQNSQENENFRSVGDNSLANRGSINTVPSHLGSAYGSDSDSASRKLSNQRNRTRRRQQQDRQVDDNSMPLANNANPNIRHEPRPDSSNVNMVQPNAQGDNPANMPYPQQPCWNSTKSNQDMRNQFTQNSHSQTMERLLGTPQMSFPPSMPFNMMMPYGMVGGCGCGCSFWGAWCWQQIVMQQREIHQLREQLNHLEERWRVETASHTLNNQVPPGNRANNYWDNFRSYSRQNLLSTNSKTNADGHLAVGPAHNPHPLVERSHNTLHHTSTSTSPSITPKRNTNAVSSTQNAAVQQSQCQNEEMPNRPSRRNVSYERSLSFSSAPDVLNVNQNNEASTSSHSRNIDDTTNTSNNVNLNRQDASNAFRNLNITNSIPEIVQSHSNNLNATTNSKKKSSSKLPAKNSTNRRNYTALDYSQTSNINIASTSEIPNPNLASTSREMQDKATSKLFDLLRENVYSEVTALIEVNESHPDFLIQIFRELQLISSDPLRQRVLQSIQNVLSQYASIIDSQENGGTHEENRPEAVSTTSNDVNNYPDSNSLSSTMQIDNKIVRFLLLQSEEIFSPERLDELASLILNTSGERQTQQSKQRVQDLLAKYEGMRVCDVSSDIIEHLPMLISGNHEGNDSSQLMSELSESSILQDVAGSLNLFSSSETQLHQVNACPYEMWAGHVHMDIDGNDDASPRSSHEGKMDLINCSEMQNGDLAEADQTHADEGGSAENSEDIGANAEALPDVVDTDEVTPTEAEAEWLGLDRVPTRLHMDESSVKQKD